MWLFLKNLLFTLILPGTIGVYVPLLLSRGRVAAGGPMLLTGGGLLFLGAALYVWCVCDFALRGRGTPAPIDPPKTLIVSGPYRYSRNPMYVAVLAAVLGWSVVFRSTDLVVYAGGAALAFTLFVRLYEEPHLSREFGAAYDAYRSRVGRWIPRFGSSGDRVS